MNVTYLGKYCIFLAVSSWYASSIVLNYVYVVKAVGTFVCVCGIVLLVASCMKTS